MKCNQRLPAMMLTGLLCLSSASSVTSASVQTAVDSPFAFLEQIASVAFMDRVVENNAVAPRTRGVPGLFERTAAAVVLIADNRGGQGSGVVISRAEGLIVTNWHVIQNTSRPSVFFKPAEGLIIEPAAMHLPEVVLLDRDADLAILRAAAIPEHVVELPLGELPGVRVGADVHAIGHPTGELWTYTRGIVSQVRTDYEWRGEANIPHRATVIQTQTPINPGNSGGPLMDDEGNIIGINSFIRPRAQGLNYAVSVDEVRALLTAVQQGEPPLPEARPPLSIPESQAPPSSDTPPCLGHIPPGFVNLPASREGTRMDSNCDGVADLTLFDTTGNGLTDRVHADTNGDGHADVRIEDTTGDGFLEYWRIDRTGNGEADLEGWDISRNGRPDKLVRLT